MCGETDQVTFKAPEMFGALDEVLWLQLSCEVHIPFDLGNLRVAPLCKAQKPGAVDETAETLR